MKKCFWLAFVFSLLAVPGSGNGEEEKERQGRSVTMEEVVVTGTRTEERVEKIPAHITVIDPEDIRHSNAKNVPDLLRSEAGVVVRDLLGNGKTAQIDLRGYGETGPFNTLVLVDGRRVNAVDLSGVDWMQIPLDQIERIEIVRGTGTVLYGDNAVGGVINIITKIPSDKLTVSGGAAFGSYSRNKDTLSLSGGKERVAASLHAGYDSTDGYRENNEMRAKDVGGKIVFDPTDSLRLNLSGSYHEDVYGLPGDLSEAEEKTNRRASNEPFNGADTKDGYLKLGSDLDLGEWGMITADLSYRGRDFESRFVSWASTSNSEMKTWGVSPRYVWQKKIFNHTNQLITGIDLYWSDQVTDSFTGTPSTLSTISDITRDSYGLYLNDEFNLTDQLILSLGMRRERVEYDLKQTDFTGLYTDLQETTSSRENAYSGGLSFLYDGKSSVFLRANRSFRFPLTDELIQYDFTTFPFSVLLNTKLMPQTGHHYEVGVRHYFSADVFGTLTLFRAKMENEIFLNPSTFSNENHPETLHQGLEFGVRAVALKKVTLYGNYTYEKATFEAAPFEGNDIPAVPRHKINLGFRIHDVIPGIIFSADYNYVGSSFLISDQANSLAKLDDYYTIDTRLSYTWKRVSAFVGLNNVTDEEYAQYGVAGGGGTTRNFYPAPERNWIGGLEFVF